MPTLDGIRILEIHEVSCPTHGVIGTRRSPEGARALQRGHFEWRHQPSPEGRKCLWRYAVGGSRPGYRYCVLGAAHLEPDHEDENGNRWGEFGSLPREDVKELYR